MSMFDKFYLTFNYKSKVSRDVFRNKNECQLTSTFIPKCHLNFGLHIILGKLILWIINMQPWFVTQKETSIKRKYPSVSHVSPTVEDGSPIHCINLKPTKRSLHKSIKGLQVQPIAQVAFDCILFGKSSHIASPCSQFVSLSLIIVSTPVYKGIARAKLNLSM